MNIYFPRLPLKRAQARHLHRPQVYSPDTDKADLDPGKAPEKLLPYFGIDWRVPECVIQGGHDLRAERFPFAIAGDQTRFLFLHHKKAARFQLHPPKWKAPVLLRAPSNAEHHPHRECFARPVQSRNHHREQKRSARQHNRGLRKFQYRDSPPDKACRTQSGPQNQHQSRPDEIALSSFN